MPEVTLTGQIRSRSSSQGSDAQRNAIKVPVPPPDSAAVGEPDRVTISSEEQNGVKNMSKKRRPHPAQLKKSVLLSLANGTEHDGGTKSPRHGSMLRRFSRAASFKKAREHLPVNIDLNGILHRFERHSTIHGICHASLAPNKRWRRFWLSVFALCLIILIIQVIYTAIKFLKYPKTVDLDLKFENAPFPSVTICNLNPYKASAIRNDIAARATMDALENVLQETGRSEGVAAAISTDNVKKARRELKRHQLNRPENGVKNKEEEKQQQKLSSSSPTAGTDWREMALAIHRRYLQVYATCYCEVSRLSSVRKQGSCYAAYKNRVTVRFLDNANNNNGTDEQQQQQHMHYFYPTKCLCQLDWMAKAIWPCFPYNTWKEHICVECVDDHGHCPMRFLDYRTANGEGNNGGGKYRKSRQSASSSHRTYAIEMLDENMDICVCHREYNHCVANNLDGEIPEIMPGDDLNLLNISHLTEGVRRRGEVSQAVVLALKTYETSNSSTNDTEEQQIIEQAMGFEEKPLDERVRLSQAKDELILKCSFNQHDCDIEKDFKLFHDPTYGNCYTFNWDRNAQVTAHRAGANYGLRVLVYANVSEYLPITEAVGFRITVHDKWTVPFVDAFGYNAPTGTLSAFGVRMKKFFRLEHPYGHCREGGERAEWYIYNKKENYNYSIEGCHRSCTQREVVRVCGCADPMFPVSRKN
ncbi:hypothetical protein niasHT_013364 [Heterodera trifolii]|uniref:Amiloride-sensitive sodium channel n=1 Tax=Heterodera trifolii TaxID=157864 RepID=A0ABD2L7V2_9BILA